jgi:hypothetical protein
LQSAFFCFGLPIAVVVLCSDELAERDPADGRHWDWLGGSFNTQQQSFDTQQIKKA